MAIDKNKIERNALKLIQKGQHRKAVAEYQKILAADPKDVRVRVKLLDLYGKIGKNAEAIEEAGRISDSYVDQGFTLRAIAIWKQVQRIDPDNPDIYSKMGELYIQQKLMGDAIAAFKRGVELLRELERFGEAGDLLARMEELSPDNVAIKVHLAELHLQEGKTEEFQQQLEKVVVQLKGEGRSRKLLHTLESLYEKSGRRIELVRPLADIYQELGEDEKALQVVHEGLSANPADRDLRLISIRANLSTGNLTDARKVALGIRDENPEDLFILEQLAAIAQARGDTEELVQWYKELAKVYGKQGLTDREEHYFKKVLEIQPNEAEASLSVGEFELPLADEPAPATQEDSELSFDLGDDTIMGGQAQAFEPVEQQPAATASSQVDEGIIEADLYIKYGLDQKAHQKLLELVESAPDNMEVRQKLRDLCWKRGDREGWLREQLTVARHFNTAGQASEALRAFQAILEVLPDNEEAQAAVQTLGGQAAQEAPEPAPPAAAEGELAAELDKVDRMASQGQSGEAVSALLRLQELYPDSEAILDRLSNLGWVNQDASFQGQPAPAAQGEDFADMRAELGDLEFDIASSIAGFEKVEVSELDDIVKEFKSGVAEKLDDGDFETHYDLGVAYKEMGLLEDALSEFQKAAQYTEKAKNAYTSMAMIYLDTGQFEDSRSALRLALAVPSNTGEDRAAILYELGLLCEKEGDWEGAVSAYEKAAALDPSVRDLTSRLKNAQARLGS